MRLFVALDPPPDAVEHLAAALPAEPDRRLRWTPREQWHVTLAFLGEVDADRQPELAERFGRAAGRTPPLGLQVAGAGTFNRTVLWCGLRGDVDPLRRLAERCTAAARRAGIAMEERRFRPHLTLARGRDRRADLRPFARALAGYEGPAWTATEIALVRSHLGPPTVHERLAAFPLTGG